jgi:hypothetical protein
VKRSGAVVTIVLWVVSFGWAQSCPSTSDLYPINHQYVACPLQAAAGWSPDASITVYEASIPLLGPAIEAAYNNWSSRLGSGVTIQPVEHGPSTSNPPLPYSIWQYGSTSACGVTTACTSTNYTCIGGWMQSTKTNITPNYPGPGYQLFTHEVGHTYGISDCAAGDCLSAVTAMQPNTSSRSAMSPHCCDSKLLYQMSYGSYGQPGQYCSPIIVQGGSASPGAAFLDTLWNEPSVSVTFPQPPQSGDTIIVGCEEYLTDSPTVTDNQTNSYDLVVQGSITYDGSLGRRPPGLSSINTSQIYAATQIQSPQTPQSFTVKCAKGYQQGEQNDPMNLFAIEVADMGNSFANIYDDGKADGTFGNGISPWPCASMPLTSSAHNDLVATLYQTDSINNPANISPTLGTIPFCNGGQGDSCVAQNGSIYLVGGMSQDTAQNPGSYTPAWNSPISQTMLCISTALKVIGP